MAQNITFDTKDLKDTLSWFIDYTNQEPDYHVYLSNGTFGSFSTDKETGAVVVLQRKVSCEGEIEISLPLEKLPELAKTLSPREADKTTFLLDDEFANGGLLTVQCGSRTFSYSYIKDDTALHPKIKDSEDVNFIFTNELRKCASRLFPFVCIDENKTSWRGIVLDGEENCLMATNGEMAAKVNFETSFPHKMLFPPTFFDMISKLDDLLYWEYTPIKPEAKRGNEEGLVFTINDGSTKIAIRPIAPIPNLKRFFPDVSNYQKMKMRRKDLLECARNLKDRYAYCTLNEGLFYKTNILYEGSSAIAFLSPQAVEEAMKFLQAETITCYTKTDVINEGLTISPVIFTDGKDTVSLRPLIPEYITKEMEAQTEINYLQEV